MGRNLRSDAALAVSVLGLGVLLVFAGNVLLGQWLSAERHRQGLSFDHLIGFVASAAGTTMVTWWAISLAIAFIASVLRRVGYSRTADILSKFSPAFMMRLVVAAMSLNLLGAGMAQAATSPDPGWQPPPAHSLDHVHAAWKRTSLNTTEAAEASVDGDAEIRELDPRWKPSSPVVDPGLLSRPSSRQATPNETSVIVKAGDSLWSIASARLGPFATDVDVAVTWPKWYEVNRDTIGSDPSVLLPGQVLRPPLPA
ncbi:LysM peptidoglycan-binding domain-containing protein [Paenarthrobacter sp. FR1]|uniref:LysM peptidoglycan-binding domain-containing protein n=1 Tax=Paenarthrobacter sp. FR1 TaxID=3439548 RepID=UPI003DA58B4A